MLRIFFAFIILIHGFIHLLGFLKAFNLAEIEQLRLPILKLAGFFWLLAGALFFISAVVYLLDGSWWWIAAGAGVIVSQALVFMYWQDAKFGTLANVIILVVCILGYGNWSFEKKVSRELHSFWSAAPPDIAAITGRHLSALPPIVQQWMQRAGVEGKTPQQQVYLKQSGEMKTSPDGKWMSVRAEQYIQTETPGFLWIADVKAAPFVHLAGRDKYIEGKGEMLIKLFSLIPVADSKGPEIDQGALLRYLAEVIWYPSAALQEYINWEQLDSATAKATMQYGGITASGIFRFNPKGEVISFEADRYYERKGGATIEKWLITIDEDSYRSFDGIRLPTHAEVTWKLAGGDFTWYKLQIDWLRFNPGKSKITQ